MPLPLLDSTDNSGHFDESDCEYIVFPSDLGVVL